MKSSSGSVSAAECDDSSKLLLWGKEPSICAVQSSHPQDNVGLAILEILDKRTKILFAIY